MTIGDAITAALQDLGVVAAGEVPAPEDSALALSRVNDWLDALATEGLTMYGRTRTTWALTSGVSAYSIGSGQTVAVVRPTGPEAILNIGYQDTSLSPVTEYLSGRPLTEDAFASISEKTFESTYPTAWYYNPLYPVGTLTCWPVPTSTTLEGVLYTANPLAEFASLTDTVALPPGYRRFLRTNLAVELAPSFQVQPSPVAVELAVAAKAAIKRANTREMDLSLELVRGLGRHTTVSRSQFDGGWF
ncbi:MAG: hypothetical protein VW405_03110 [Rhodospirillaceae bacterium]